MLWPLHGTAMAPEQGCSSGGGASSPVRCWCSSASWCNKDFSLSSRVSFQCWLFFWRSCHPCVHALTYVCMLKIPITGCTKTQHAPGQFSKTEHGCLSGGGIWSGPVHNSWPQKWPPYLRKKRDAEEEDSHGDSVSHSCWKSKLRSTQAASHWQDPHLLNINCSGGGWWSLRSLRLGALGTSSS